MFCVCYLFLLFISVMAPHSGTLAWKHPWTEEPGGLQSIASLRVRHDWVTSLSLFTFMHWRRKWQPTPVFLPGESQGWGSLVGCRLWGCPESDMTAYLLWSLMDIAEHGGIFSPLLVTFVLPLWEFKMIEHMFKLYQELTFKSVILNLDRLPSKDYTH